MIRADEIAAYVPQVRPHNQFRDGKLFFMVSRRPLLELSREEILLYDSIDGRKSVAELEGMYPGARHRLMRWHDAAIIELIPPITSPSGPHLVIIEPHMDDAALSMGGRLLHRRGRCRITILSVIRWSNFTSYMELNRPFLDVHNITKLREQESALAARVLGAEHCCLDWYDAPLRIWPAERWSPDIVQKFNENPGTFVNFCPDSSDVLHIAEQLIDRLSLLAPDEIWIPMGVGDHVDHRTTRSACLLMLAKARGRFLDVPVVMYEDVTAPADFGYAAKISMALAGGGARLVRGTEDITDVFEEKLRVLSIFASQFKLSYMEPRIRKFGEHEGGSAGKFAEPYYRVEGEPCLPLESQLFRKDPASLQTDIHRLLPKMTKYRRLTVMALPSGRIGTWKANKESLMAAFPNIDLRGYVSEKTAWQAEEGGKDKLRLQVVRGRWRGWGGVILRNLFRFQTPTLILWYGAYGTSIRRRLIKWMLPFRYVLFSATLCDFICILNEQLGNIDKGFGL